MSEFWKTSLSRVRPGEILVRGYPDRATDPAPLVRGRRLSAADRRTPPRARREARRGDPRRLLRAQPGIAQRRCRAVCCFKRRPAADRGRRGGERDRRGAWRGDRTLRPPPAGGGAEKDPGRPGAARTEGRGPAHARLRPRGAPPRPENEGPGFPRSPKNGASSAPTPGSPLEIEKATASVIGRFACP